MCRWLQVLEEEVSVLKEKERTEAEIVGTGAPVVFKTNKTAAQMAKENEEKEKERAAASHPEWSGKLKVMMRPRRCRCRCRGRRGCRAASLGGRRLLV